MRKMIIVRHRVIQWCLTVFIVIGELYGLEKLWKFLQYFPRSKDRKLDARIILGAIIVIGELYGLEKFCSFLQCIPRGRLNARIKVHPSINEWLSRYQELE